MKKYVIVASLALVFTACADTGASSSNAETTASVTSASTTAVTSADSTTTTTVTSVSTAAVTSADTTTTTTVTSVSTAAATSADTTTTTTVTSVSTVAVTSADTTTTTTTTTAAVTAADSSAPETGGLLKSKDDLHLTNTDGVQKNYDFDYAGEKFTAVYTTDNWKIVNSYKIDNKADMLLICAALSDEHQIHGRDMVSWRTPEDMVYEWQQHNLAYSVLPDDSKWKINARDVDLNPEDQGKSLYELFLSRINR